MTVSPSAVLAYGRGELSEPILERTIGDALRAAAALRGPCTALVEGTLGAVRRRWSYDQLLAEAEQTARALLARFSPGERVAVWAGNCPEWVFLEFGAALAGLTLVTVNPAYLGREAAYVLGKSRASGVVVQPVYRGRRLWLAQGICAKGLPSPVSSKVEPAKAHRSHAGVCRIGISYRLSEHSTMARDQGQLQAGKDATFYNCFLCNQPFQFGPHAYNGRPVRAWDVMLCDRCLRANHDGIVLDEHPRLAALLRERGITIELNEKGWLPIPPRSQ